MIYLENDFYSNFNSMVESNDEMSLHKMFVDQISNLIAYKKQDLVSLFKKIDIKVSEKPTNKELSDIIANNFKSNKKLQVGLAYLIAESNNLMQQEMKKSRNNEDAYFEGEVINENDPLKSKRPATKPVKNKKPVDWNKGADAVTSIASSISVLADTITQTKTGQLGSDLTNASNVKSPEELKQEEEANKIKEAKAKKRKRNIIIGVVVLAVGITAIIGYKKGWFSKIKEINN
jgi:hypothetical protein